MQADQTYSAFTTSYGHISRVLISEIEIITDNGRKTAKALWDTGATGSCIADEVAKELGMIPTGKQTIKTPSGEKEVNTFSVDLKLPNNVVITDVTVCGTDIGNQGIDALIGMDVISLGDFAVSNIGGKTMFTYRVPSKAEADYVKEMRREKLIGPKHGKGKRKKKK